MTVKWSEEEDIAKAISGDVGARLRVEVLAPFCDLIRDELKKLNQVEDPAKIDKFFDSVITTISAEILSLNMAMDTPTLLIPITSGILSEKVKTETERLTLAMLLQGRQK